MCNNDVAQFCVALACAGPRVRLFEDNLVECPSVVGCGSPAKTTSKHLRALVQLVLFEQDDRVPSLHSDLISQKTPERCQTFFESDHRRAAGPHRSRVHVRYARSFCAPFLISLMHPTAKKQRFVDAFKVLLDIAKESSDVFPPLKSCLGGISALIKHYEVCQCETMPDPANHYQSAI